MEEKVISTLSGVGIYGVISILIFVTFFVVALLWVMGLKQNYIEHMGDLPLDKEEQNPEKSNASKSI